MNNILVVVAFEALAPFMLRLGQALEAMGCKAHFAAFTPKEHALLVKNSVSVVPDRLPSYLEYEGQDGRIPKDAMLRLLEFTMRKFGGDEQLWLARARVIERALDAAFNSKKIDAVFAWNGDEYIAAIAVQLAVARGLPVIYGENGYFSNTLQIDSKGVNARSSIRERSLEEMRRALSETNHSARMPPADFKLQPVHGLTAVERAFVALRRRLDRHDSLRYPEFRTADRSRTRQIESYRAQIPEDAELPQSPYVFIPFQVHDDTQILLNSPLFNSVPAFFEFAHAAVRQVLGSDYLIVVKEHPEDLGRADYADLKARYPDVMWLRKCNLDRLLDNASMVLVVNSSVGLQSIAKHRPTVTFGTSFYARPELSFHVNAREEIQERLQAALKGYSRQQIEAIDLFVDYLKSCAFVAAGWRSDSPESLWAVADRIFRMVATK